MFIADGAALPLGSVSWLLQIEGQYLLVMSGLIFAVGLHIINRKSVWGIFNGIDIEFEIIENQIQNLTYSMFCVDIKAWQQSIELTVLFITILNSSSYFPSFAF